MLVGLGIEGSMVAETLKADWLLFLYSLQTIVCMFLTPLGLKFLKSLLNCFISDQCVESRLQVKMNSPDSARAISIKQEEPDDHPHFSKFNHFNPSIAMQGKHLLKIVDLQAHNLLIIMFYYCFIIS